MPARERDGALFIGPDGLGRAVFEERLGALSGFSCVKDGERALYLCLAEKPFPDGMDMPGLEMFPVRNILGNNCGRRALVFDPRGDGGNGGRRSSRPYRTL
ncbi:MAG: hypothetical protein ACLR7Z_01145 [Bilophila wadsworthia]